MDAFKRILVIGSTGHFGKRISRRLVGEPGIELIVSSRRLAAAQELVSEIQSNNPNAPLQAVALNQDEANFESDLANISPDIVIHTAGPYQNLTYKVAEACINCGSHYIDLADGREFVAGFQVLDQKAKEAGVLLVSGASTLPGLSGAVIDYYRAEFTSLESVEISIAPAHQTPRGRGTIAAVLSYCGNPILVLENGDWIFKYGWHDLQTHVYPTLGRRWSGICDVPDLELLPQYLPELKTATFHAALEAKWEQIALWVMGWLVRGRVVSDWTPFIPTFDYFSEKLIRWGSDRGGMRITLGGKDHNDKKLQIVWDLTALNNHGPEIPCSPALILARALKRDDINIVGALPCLGLFTLADFEREVSGFDISWSVS